MSRFIEFCNKLLREQIEKYLEDFPESEWAYKIEQGFIPCEKSTYFKILKYDNQTPVAIYVAYNNRNWFTQDIDILKIKDYFSGDTCADMLAVFSKTWKPNDERIWKWKSSNGHSLAFRRFINFPDYQFPPDIQKMVEREAHL